MDHRRNSVGLSISLPKDLKAWLKARADIDRGGISEIIRKLIVEEMRREQKLINHAWPHDIVVGPSKTTTERTERNIAAENRPTGIKSYDRKHHK